MSDEKKKPWEVGNLALIPSIRGGGEVVQPSDVSLTGDKLVDSMASQLLSRLDADREEADDLYEAIRGMAEGNAEDASMQRAAIEALKLRHSSSDKALKVLELIAKIKLAKERREGGGKDNLGKGTGNGLMDIIEQENDSKE